MKATVIALRSRTSMPEFAEQLRRVRPEPRPEDVGDHRQDTRRGQHEVTDPGGRTVADADVPTAPSLAGLRLRHAHLDDSAKFPKPSSRRNAADDRAASSHPHPSIDLDRDEAIVTGLVERRQDVPEIEAAGPERPAVGLAEVDVPGARAVESDRLDDRAFLDVHVERVEHDPDRGGADPVRQRGGLGDRVVEADLEVVHRLDDERDPCRSATRQTRRSPSAIRSFAFDGVRLVGPEPLHQAHDDQRPQRGGLAHVVDSRPTARSLTAASGLDRQRPSRRIGPPREHRDHGQPVLLGEPRDRLDGVGQGVERRQLDPVVAQAGSRPIRRSSSSRSSIGS